MQIKKDNYYLGQSSVVKVSGKGSDNNANIKLEFNKNSFSPAIGSTLSGTVNDSNGNPIKDAVVKLMDGNLKPLTFAYTDSSGNYYIDTIPYSPQYSIVSIAAGKLLSEVKNINIFAGQNIKTNFVLIDDLYSKLGAISGVLTDTSTIEGNPLKGAILQLYTNVNNVETLMQISYTDDFGEFMFAELTPGFYNITATVLGYSKITMGAIVEEGKITFVTNTGTLSTIEANSVISGVILDDKNNKVEGADVILYSIDSLNNLEPISYTTTNSLGVYTFINVAVGNYIVKSTQSQLIEISPFSTSSFTPLASGESIVAYDGNLKELNDFNFKNSNKSEDIVLNTLNNKTENISESSFEKNDNTNNKNLNLPRSTPKIPLNAKLIFSKDLIPSISNDFNKEENISENDDFNIFMADLQNGAKIDFTNKCIKNIGGFTEGTLSITYDCKQAGNYNLTMEVENIKGIFIINLNNKELFTLSSEIIENKERIFITKKIPLNFGKNIIKIYGAEKNYSPKLYKANLDFIKSPKIPLKATLPPGIYNIASGILSNGAYVNNGYASNIGGTEDGNSVVNILINEANLYNLKINYRNLENIDKALKIEVNGIDNEKIYWLKPAKLNYITINLSLKKGVNSIKFKGNGIDYSADLGIFTVLKNSYTTNELKF
ncbi:carboxypeptidase regulatory-like domain-containing protein [Clostridium tarantellae]|uniref:Carboxypeptidase regulatory-like domain-containing protein n=1 Tax=Clostridium tarantellae TaxID=39493 RepID=A0A6I1MNA5_9CLOT|nr:carboxypeptidase regulatory-like domain-containing protein [Clostridium tarantellae]MPQ44976.1 hypothetical protein [Clostridium tarantellae]